MDLVGMIMEKFPIEILENILFRLPFTAALQATKVCKTWKTLLANRCCNEVGFLVSYHLFGNDEIQLYFGEQYDIHGDVIDHPTKMMNYYYGKFHKESQWNDLVVGSCNGLVCLRKRDQSDEIQYLVCNPLTGEHFFVPQFDYASLQDKDGELDPLARYASVKDGFGYCDSTNEYKVVRIYYSEADVGNVLVYTIGSHEWRNTGITHHQLRSGSVFANGVLHWLYADIRENKVFGFDLKDEKFQLLPVPLCDRYFQFFNKQIKLLGGNLCLVQHTNGYAIANINKRSGPCVEIWAYKRNAHNMKERDQKHHYYDKNSWNWIKEFEIETGYEIGFEPFAVTRSNQVLLWHRVSILYCYDPNTSALKELGGVFMDDGMRPLRIEAIPHTNSFVSLKDLGETGATIRRRETSRYSRQAKGKGVL